MITAHSVSHCMDTTSSLKYHNSFTCSGLDVLSVRKVLEGKLSFTGTYSD
jgi:hypothetical protein